jgi:hypothetical protein
MTGVPHIGLTTFGLGASTGDTIAMPPGARYLTVDIEFEGGAPGASVYRLQQSMIDNPNNWHQIGADITEALSVRTELVNTQFVRINQVSKTNGVTARGRLLVSGPVG